MSQATIAPPKIRTLADLWKRLGDIPLDRIRFEPPPGTATEEDVLELDRREGRLCELVDGTLVEKAVGAAESYVAWLLGHLLDSVSRPERPGDLPRSRWHAADLARAGSDSRPVVHLVGQAPRAEGLPEAVSDLYPDLAVEVLSEGNTPAEMRPQAGGILRRRGPPGLADRSRKRTARVHTSARPSHPDPRGPVARRRRRPAGLLRPLADLFNATSRPSDRRVPLAALPRRDRGHSR